MIPPTLTEKLDKAEEISRKACMSYMFHPVWQSQFSQRATHYQTVKNVGMDTFLGFLPVGLVYYV